MSTNKQWFAVAGHYTDHLQQNTASFVAVEAASANESLETARQNEADFHPVSTLSEENLLAILAKINAAKEAAQS